VQNYPYETISRYRGWISFETAIAESRNAATVWLVKQIGIEKVIEIAKRLGIQSELQPYPTTSIGASEVTLLELTAALMPMVNGGYKLPPFLVSEIYDGAGKLLYRAEINPKKVLDDDVAEKMKKLLQAVVDAPTGTAHRLRNTFRDGELAGKTGTATNEKGEATDNWFIGFTPRYAIGVWLGLDNKKPLGNRETGGRNALPVFEKIVAEAGLINPDEIFTSLLPQSEQTPETERP
jgi:penicillin-binding protein 1A